LQERPDPVVAPDLHAYRQDVKDASIGAGAIVGSGVVGMEPVTLIVAALAAGASLGVKDAASAAVVDAYGALKTLVRERLAGRRDGELVLARHQESPNAWETPLAVELKAVGAGSDSNILRAAQALLSLTDPVGCQQGKYAVDVRSSHGVQVGDGNTQHNVFYPPPDRR